MVGFGEAVSRFYRNYFNFEGRASRAEYWWPVLMQAIVYIGLIIAIVVMVGMDTNSGSEDIGGGPFAVMVSGLIFALFNVIPSYSAAARRFHDLDQTGWLVLVFAIANAFIFVSVVAQLIWFAQPGTNGSNQYGPDPYGPNSYENDVDIFR